MKTLLHIFIFFSTLFISIIPNSMIGQISVGDIAIIGINTDNVDAFGFVALVDIPSNTEIHFTDNAILGDGSLRTTEGTLIWSCSSIITKGSVIIDEGGTWSAGSSTGTIPFLSSFGDQIIAYTGSPDNPTFIYALNIANSGWITSGDPTSLTSYLPPGLTEGTNAISVGTDDNGYYNGNNTGEKSELLSSICNRSNWYTDNTRILVSTWPNIFSVTTTGKPDAPSIFAASPIATTEISLSWNQNANNNNVMVAYSLDGNFGTPKTGTSYTPGNTLEGGGSILYNGSNTTYNHKNLTSNTKYYYQAWSVDGSLNYSEGVTTEETTFKEEPSNQVMSFSAGNPTSFSIPLSWNDNDGTVVADGYLIMINTTNTFTDPVDGTAQTDDTDFSNGSGQVNVNHDAQSYICSGLNPSTLYYFKIWAYTNSSDYIDYKTNGTIPTTNATTLTAAQEPVLGDLYITEVVGDAADQTADDGYMEIYNSSDHEISLSNISIRYYNSNPGEPTKTISLNGTITSKSFIIATQNNDNFQSHYGYYADFSASTFYFNGGDDGIDIFHSTLGILDQFNDNGASQSPWQWDDQYSWERKSKYSGAVQSNWVETASDTPKSFGVATWNGSTSSDWNLDANWSFVTPKASMDVYIPKNVTHQLSIETAEITPATCTNLTIEAGGCLTLPVDKGLNVSNALTVASNETENGSLLVNGTLNGTVSVQRSIPGYTSKDNGWHIISAPVQGMNISGSDFEPGNTDPNDDDFYDWDEVDNLWLNYKDGANNITQFNIGEGYLVAYQTTETKSFTGTLYNQDVPLSGLTYNSTLGSGWHLLGNPYPTDLIWGDNNWQLNHVNATAKIWSNSVGNYLDISSGEIIPSTQGFFIEVNNETNSLTIPASGRTLNTNNNYKEAHETNQKTMTFKVSNDQNGYYDICTIGFNNSATDNFDAAFDAHKLFSLINTSPQIWSTENSVDFSTNYLFDNEEGRNISLPFKPGVNGIYHLVWSGIETMNNNQQLTLVDKKEDKSIDMRNFSSYDFNADKGDEIDRFELDINNTTGIEENPSNDIMVYAAKNILFIKSSLNTTLSGNLSVCNLLGNVVYQKKLTNVSYNIIHLQLNTGIYIVHIELKDGSDVARKIIIKQ